MRKALVAFGILVLVLVGADFGLRALGEHWVSGQLQDSFELDQRPSVSLGGFPFLPRLVTGRFPSVTVEATGTVRTGRFPVSAVHLALQDVRFPPDQLLFGNKATIRAERGSGTAILTEQGINRAFPATVPITIRLSNGKVHIRTSGQREEVETRLRIVENRLVLVPEGPLPVEVRVGLPIFVPGLTYTGVKVEGSRARLIFRLTTPSIQLR
jgi:LmeA-like phospholipid-binding